MKIRFAYAIFLLIAISCSGAQKKSENPGIDGGEIIPRNYKSIYIHNFENKTYEGGLTGQLKDFVVLEFGADGRFLIAADKNEAELLLFGTIDLFSMQPRNIDQFGQAKSFNMTIVATVWVRVNPKANPQANTDNGANRALPDKKLIRFDTTYTPRLPPFESRQEAMDRLLGGLARRIHVGVVKGWYTELKTREELGK